MNIEKEPNTKLPVAEESDDLAIDEESMINFDSTEEDDKEIEIFNQASNTADEAEIAIARLSVYKTPESEYLNSDIEKAYEIVSNFRHLIDTGEIEDIKAKQKEVKDMITLINSEITIFKKGTSGNLEDNKAVGKRKNLLDNIGESIQGKMNEDILPSKDHKSTVGFYGGKLKYYDGKLVWDNRGAISTIDRFGDAVLRTYDEHVIKNPIEMFKRNPKLLLKFLAPGTKRYRGTKAEIVENIKRLGLEDFYGEHENGIEIKNQDLFTNGVAFQDIYRSELIESERLQEIDRFDALRKIAEYISDIHDKHGAIGEILPSDFIFKNNEKGVVSNPILNIPDIVFNKEKNTSEIDKKTTDLLDFTMSVGIEELQRSEDWNEVKKAIETIVHNYKDKKVISILRSFVLRGRLTMQSKVAIGDMSESGRKILPLAEQHNKARLNLRDKNIVNDLRNLILSICDENLETTKLENN